MQINIQRSALIIFSAIGLTACAANFHAPPAPNPVKPLFRCVASGEFGAQWSWVSGDQQVAINRALLECQREGGQNCQITRCSMK